METVIIVIHLMVIVALIAVVLLQRSEGGALGIGGSGSFMTSRGQGNVLTRATTILGIAFFATSIAMTVLGQMREARSSVLDTLPVTTAPTAPLPGEAPVAPEGGGGILDQLNQFNQPAGETPAAGAGAPTPVAPQDPAPQ